MKTICAVVVLAGSLAVGLGQDVFVLGGPGTTPVPPIVYQPPIVADGAANYQPAVAAVPVYAAVPLYSVTSSCAPTYYNPNVIYVGGPGSCGPNYYRYPQYSTPNVIYFGRGQAYREGYNFGHCR